MKDLLLLLLLQVAPAIHEHRPVRVSGFVRQAIPAVFCMYRYQPKAGVWLFYQHRTLALGIQAGGQPSYYALFRVPPEQQQP